MKVAPLVAVALILCIAIPGPIHAKKKPKPKPKPKPNRFCIGKDGNQYAVGKGYDDNDGKACVHYKCVKKNKKFVMKKGKCVSLTVDGEWSDWSRWSACGDATKTRKRTCSNPPPSDDGSPCPGMKEEIEECSLPSCGSVENVNVTALELNVQSLNDTMQSLNDSVQSLETTMQAVLELLTTMQSTANKQGTCLSDLSSSDCPSSAAGKVGVVDGIAANTDGITSNTDTCSSIQATATKLETCLGDVSSVNCPSSKDGKTSVSDAIMENKDALMTHHPAQTDGSTIQTTTIQTTTTASTIITAECSTLPIKNNGQWRCSGSTKLCTLKCNPSYASLYSTTTCIDGAWTELGKMECSPSVFLLLGGSTESIYTRMTTEADITTAIYHPQIKNLTCSNPPPTLYRTWTGHVTFLHNGLGYMCGGDNTKDLCTSLNMTNLSSQRKSYNISQTVYTTYIISQAVVMRNMVYFIGGKNVDNFVFPLPLENKSSYSPFFRGTFENRYHCIVKVDEDSFIITGGIPSYGENPSYNDTTVIKFNVMTRSLTVLPQQSPRFAHGCVMVEEGDKRWIVVAGGVGLSSTQRLNLDGGAQWESLGDLNGYRDSFGMVETENGIVAIGGNLFNPMEFSSISLDTVELLNWSTQQWKLLEPSLKTPRHRFGQPLEVPASVFGCYIPTDWTIIQRRGQYGNLVTYFEKDFKDYENGFGSVDRELWIGLKELAALTKDGEWELQVDFTDWDDKKYHAKYATFSVGPAPTYKLHVGGFKDGESTLGDSMDRHDGQAFSTRDKDQDAWSSNSCAVTYRGGWWYKDCLSANLNGLNFAEQRAGGTGLLWFHGKSRGNTWKTWKASVMKIKRVKV